MTISLAYLICFGIVFYKVLKTVLKALKDGDISSVMQDIVTDVALFITFFIYLNFSEKITSFNYDLITKYLGAAQSNNVLVRIVFEVIIFFVIKWIIDVVLSFIQNIFFKDSFSSIETNRGATILLATIVGILKGGITLIGIFIIITIINTFMPSAIKINVFEDIRAYRQIESFINKSGAVKNYPELISRVANKGIVYYNGITIEDGIKSNEEINSKARNIVSGLKTDREKAKALYSYVGTNIKYDYNKAEDVQSDNFSNKSGAIEAFNTKKGICLDYACLYVAMCREVGLKVRVVVGDLKEGNSYTGHAWNEVYLSDENKWIQVDPTNFTAGNYFDNKQVEGLYRATDIAGEW